MLLEMPDCKEDFFAWQPMSYSQHFAASRFKDREVTIAAYQAAEPSRRERLDALADTMNKLLTATREVMRLNLRPAVAAQIADLAVRRLKPLIARAGAVINGAELDNHRDRPVGAVPQAVVDALMAR
jgi:hypothetical protein